jgi:hypothetical protein
MDKHSSNSQIVKLSNTKRKVKLLNKIKCQIAFKHSSSQTIVKLSNNSNEEYVNYENQLGLSIPYKHLERD